MKNSLQESALKVKSVSKFSRYKGQRLTGPRFEIQYTDDLFPEALRRIPDPPQCLYAIGNVSALCEGLAVVGARKATPYGLFCASHFASRAAERGITIISGGAVGCDCAAHQAALEKSGKTVVFLGGGCDELYPAKNRDLFQQIIDSHGVIVSELPWNHPPLPHTFRARNRLIAGLSRATLIVEAGLPSGTFSTADEALNASKDVLAIPGSILSRSSHGANRLIYQGAIPIVDDEGFDDIMHSLFGLLRQETSKDILSTKPLLTTQEELIYEFLCAQTMSIDEIIQALTSRGTPTQMSHLGREITQLEMKGLIARYPNGKYGANRLV